MIFKKKKKLISDTVVNPHRNFMKSIPDKGSVLRFNDIFNVNSFFRNGNNDYKHYIKEFFKNKSNNNSKNHSTVKDKLFNEYLESCRSEDQYLVCPAPTPGEKSLVAGPDFNYKINSEGFRSKSFNEFNVNDKNILFAGCSMTFGVGLPENLTWTDILLNKINSSGLDKYTAYNIGAPGVGIEIIYKNVLAFVESVGKPDKICILFPNISRGIIYDEAIKAFIYSDVNLNRDKKVFDQKYKDIYSHEYQLYKIISVINSLEIICKAKGIDLFWSTWEFDGETFFECLDFKNFLPFNEDIWLKMQLPPGFYNTKDDNTKEKKMEYLIKCQQLEEKNLEKMPYWSSARDGHPGLYFMQTVAENFFKEMKN